MVAEKLYGPFVHGLNNGGLKEIVITGKLRGAVGGNNMANDRSAVRAYTGPFETRRKIVNWKGRDRTYIEFMTNSPSCTGLVPGSAEWDGDQLIENHLPIRITLVLNGEGEPVGV